MTMICSYADDITNTQVLRKRLRRLEIYLFFGVAGTLLLGINNLIAISSLSVRIQDIEDKVSPSLQKIDNGIKFLSGVKKSFLKQLEDQHNAFDKRFDVFEKENRISNKRSNEEKMFSNNVDKFVKKKSVEEFKEKKNKAHKPSTERKTQINQNDLEFIDSFESLFTNTSNNNVQNSSDCDDNLFQLSLHLNGERSEKRWELIDSVDKSLIAHESHEEAEVNSVQHSTICISDGSYIFTIFGYFGDGICVGEDKCSPYNISINTELVIEGTVFDSKQSHNINIYNDNICVGNFLELQIQMKENLFRKKRWELIDTKSNKVLANQTHNTNSLCVDDGIYLFSLLNLENENMMDNEYMKITVNGDVLIDGPLLIRFRFRIIDGLVETHICAFKPILTPINDFTGNGYDERIDKLLGLFESLSSHDAIHNDETSQYKAACYILYDDVNQMKVEDELTTERYILYLFFISTELFTWGQTLPSNLCDINGLWCDDDGHIIRLDFSNRNLVRTIPTELGHLAYLTRLDLYNNDFTGTIPTQLARLTHLEYLYLFNNKLGGTIPSEIGKINKLEDLWLFNNNLSGSIPSQLFDATELKWLHLYSNRLTGSISTSIGQLDKLEYLILDDNQLTGSLPTQVGFMSSLIIVELNKNKLVGKVPTEIRNWKNIKELWISSNQINGTLPDVFDNFPQLEVLDANDNLFSGEIPSSLWRVDSLSALWLQKNDLHGSVPDNHCDQMSVLRVDTSKWLVDSPKVNCSCCDSCQFWDAVFNPTGTNTKCPDDNILYLLNKYGIYSRYIKDVHTNDTSNSPYQGICISPTGCYEVKGDEWNNFQVNTDIKKEFYFGYSNTSRSVVLSDPQNRTCDAVKICGKLIDSNNPKRNFLNYFLKVGLSDSSILEDPESYQYQALCWIINHEAVDDLDECDGTLYQFCIIGLFFSSTNYLNSSGPFSPSDHLCDFDGIECDRNNRFIEAINFHNKNLTGTLITEIGLLESLKKIDLSDNQMKGEIDQATFNDKLPKLEIFDINNNLFEGEIPNALLSHPSLKELNVSSNLFVGTLPSSFHNSSKLESIEVADNLLHGEIPNELFDCLQLRTIDVSQNKINGIVPTLIGQLSKIENIHLNENEIRGSLPTQIANLTQIKVIKMQSNKLTGSIPTSVGTLQNLTQLILNHNRLKGRIPSELQNLKQLKTLHLHHNQLTGIAPKITVIDMTNYITDCGFPNYALPKPLTCDSCTICCNSDDACQKRKSTNNIWKSSMQIVGLTTIGFISLLSLRSIYKTVFGKAQMNLKHIYTETSVHSFIFAEGIAPKTIYFLSICLQFTLFVVYMLASDINKEATDWKFTYQCPDNRIDCIDLKKVNNIGWLLFTIVIFCFMGPDMVMSVKQLDQGIMRTDASLLVSGCILFFLTIFATYSSFVYNRALAERNTDLILNAIVLIFIMELDDQMYKICKKLFPKWTENIEKDIERKMK